MKTTAQKEARQAYLFILPAVAVLMVVAAYPIVAGTLLSLHRYILVFGERSFIGLDNFAFLLRDGRFWSALGNTAYFSVVAVCVEFLLALPLALLLNTASPGRTALRAAVLVPWAIPTVVAARTWSFLFNPDYGAVAAMLPFDANWLGTPGFAMHAAILVDVWKTTPFVALLLLAGLQGISEDLYRAARIDGAGPFKIFFAITLPLLKPAIAVALVFRALDAFRVFDAIYVLTEGGPANSTETLSIYAYKVLMRSGDFGFWSALAVVTFGCIAALAATMLVAMGKSAGVRR